MREATPAGRSIQNSTIYRIKYRLSEAYSVRETLFRIQSAVILIDIISSLDLSACNITTALHIANKSRI